MPPELKPPGKNWLFISIFSSIYHFSKKQKKSPSQTNNSLTDNRKNKLWWYNDKARDANPHIERQNIYLHEKNKWNQ